MNPGVTLVLGGARSGKSRFAEARIEASGLDPVYIATGRAFDPEMEARIGLHRGRRGPDWTTVEAPVDLLPALREAARPGAAILVDCLTLWITNLMLEDRAVDAEGEALVAGLAEDLARGLPAPILFVSNEVGLGIVPDNAMARAFRDHAGRLHQSIAQISGEVFFVSAGLPLTLKG